MIHIVISFFVFKFVFFSLPSGPRFILFREYLPIMKPLLDELRDIAKKRNKSVAQVSQLLMSLIYAMFGYIYYRDGIVVTIV